MQFVVLKDLMLLDDSVLGCHVICSDPMSLIWTAMFFISCSDFSFLFSD